MPRTAEQNRQIREATRTTIINSGMILFAQNGYAHTTIKMIAEQANISTGLMYHYFNSKENLLHAVFENCMRILSEAFNDALQQAKSVDRVTALLHVIFDILVIHCYFNYAKLCI